MTLIRLIATFILIYLIFRLFITLFFPALLRWFINRQKRKFYAQNPHLRPDDPPRKKKSKTTYSDHMHTKSKGSMDEIGEYVDFEEIKDEKEKQKKSKKNKT